MDSVNNEPLPKLWYLRLKKYRQMQKLSGIPKLPKQASDFRESIRHEVPRNLSKYSLNYPQDRYSRISALLDNRLAKSSQFTPCCRKADRLQIKMTGMRQRHTILKMEYKAQAEKLSEFENKLNELTGQVEKLAQSKTDLEYARSQDKKTMNSLKHFLGDPERRPETTSTNDSETKYDENLKSCTTSDLIAAESASNQESADTTGILLALAKKKAKNIPGNQRSSESLGDQGQNETTEVKSSGEDEASMKYVRPVLSDVSTDNISTCTYSLRSDSQRSSSRSYNKSVQSFDERRTERPAVNLETPIGKITSCRTKGGQQNVSSGRDFLLSWISLTCGACLVIAVMKQSKLLFDMFSAIEEAISRGLDWFWQCFDDVSSNVYQVNRFRLGALCLVAVYFLVCKVISNQMTMSGHSVITG